MQRQLRFHEDSPDPRGRELALVQEDRLPIAYQGAGAALPEDDEDEINLREYWQVILRRKWTIIYFFLFVVVVAVLTTYLMTPIYRSTLVMQIERESAKVVDFQDVTPDERGSDTRDFYQTQYALLQSRTLVRRVIDELGLEHDPVFLGQRDTSFFAALGARLSASAADGDKGSEVRPDLESRFLDALTVAPVRNSRLVHIQFDSPDPKLAARVVNTLAKNFVNTTLERRFDASSYAKEFLSERIKQVRANLEDSELALARYAQEREIIDLDQKQGFLMQQVKDLNKELVAAESRRIDAETEYAEVQKARGVGHLRILNDPVVQKYKEMLVSLEGDYEENLRVFKPAYPKMVKLRAEIDQLKARIQEQVEQVRAAVTSNYRAAVNQEAMLRANMAELKNEILELQNRSTDYHTLKRDVETNRKLYDGLLQRMKEVGVAAGIGTNNISIVDPGEVPRGPHKPSLTENLLLAAALGLFGGIGLAFLFEHLDDSIKSAQDLESKLGLAVLGVVPEVKGAGRRAETVALLTHEDPKSAVAEAYRSFRTALSFSTSSGTPKLLHFTSSGAGEGKTTTAISCAIAYTQMGKRVLLLDCDLRNPSLHKELDVPNELGLTNYLAGAHSPAQVVQKTRIKGLWLITTGPIPPNPVELLSGGRMLDLLVQGEERFDLVIVDSPPVLGLADSLILANMSRTTVMVVDAGVTRRDAIAGSLRRLRGAQANILGALLTKYGQGSSGYGYDYNYSYNYYGYESSDGGPRLKLTST
jgi:succinoglycan biosynthesis transport protein ExoP